MREARDRSDAPIVAVDLGGTKTRVALVAPGGAVLAREVQPTGVEDSHPDALVASVRRLTSGTDARRAVVGVPGRVDHELRRLEHAPNLPPHWATHLTEEQLSAAWELEVSIANDADLAAVGEHRFGAGRGTNDMVYVTLSTGVGCGVILGDRLARGRRSIAEAGHIVIDRSAEEGRRTLEQTASGTALGRRAEEASTTAGGGEVLVRALAGDAGAAAAWDDVVSAAAAGIASLAHLFSPELVVVGGGLGLVGEPLYEPIREALSAQGPRGLPEPIRVTAAELGDDAALIGAAGWLAATRTTT